MIEKGAVEFYEVCALSMNARREGRTGVRPSLAAAISMIVCALRKWSHWSAPLPRRRYFRRRDASGTFCLFGSDNADGDDGDDRENGEQDLPFQAGCGNLCIVLRLSLLGELEAFDGNGLRIL